MPVTITATPHDLISLVAPGAQVVVRDEEWLVRSAHQTPTDGVLVRCLGTSTLVRDTEATFFTHLDRIEPLRPEETRLVLDDSPNFRRSRLCLEAVIRKELFDETWLNDGWTVDAVTEPELAGALGRAPLGAVGAEWTMATPLRRDMDRRQALAEIAAIAAIMLGLSAEQLCAMHRTQLAVLRKHEYRMAFDAEGRSLCGYHQSAGYRQSQLQARAKAGDLPREWSNLWKLYEQYEDDPSSVDWRGHHTPPFTRPDREAEMTRVYRSFQARLATLDGSGHR